MVTGNFRTAEVKVYDMAEFFTYNHLKTNLTSQLQTNDCLRLANFFAFPEDQTDAIFKSDTPTENLLLALEVKRVIQPSNVDRLAEAFTELKISLSCYYLVDFYQKTRTQATLYVRFLATLSAHLTASLPGDLCGYFNIPDEEKRSITSSQNPGLSLLLALDEKSIIKPSEVEALDQPFTELRLVQAVAKVHEYQSEVKGEKNQLQNQTELTEEGKIALFIQCLQKKIQSWYETMTPVPWKKSCRWKSTDLFVGSGLVLTDSKAKRSLTNIDEECKLQYTQILNHDRLKTQKRIILEGEPGSGKTMMSSQLAYDWSIGKISEVDVLFFLPLKLVNNITLLEAIKRFYFSAHGNVSVNEIEGFLTNEDLQSCLILDGLEEYNSGGMTSTAEPSEVVKVMEKSKYPNCKVILTSRSDYAKDLPACPILRIGRFGEKERNTYIEKVFADNSEKQQEIKRAIEDTPFILDLCSVPLLFVLAVHNVESMGRLGESQVDRVAPFMENMVRTLCSSSESTREDSSLDVKNDNDESLLEEYAYNGLCKGRQILSWRKDTLERNIFNLKQYLDSGILVVEEGIIKGTVRNVQEETQEDESSQKIKELKTNKKEATEIDQLNKNTEGATGAIASPSHQRQSVGEGSNENVAVAGGIPVLYETEKHISRMKRLMKRFTPKIFTKKKDVDTDEATHKTVANVRAEDLPTHELVQDDRDRTTRGSAVTSPSKAESTQSESESDAESELSESQKTSNGSTAKHFPMQVKFLHKVMQEWFASKHFSSMLWKSWGDNSHRELLHDVLPQISPIDLHYVLRFTSYLCPPSCYLIMDFLIRSHHTEHGAIPEYIMNCVCLCFAECNEHMELHMKDVVAKVCAEIIPIRSDDSRLIQQSKLKLMRFAASVGILIREVQLIDVVSEVGEKSFTFNSGVTFDVFNMIQVIEVSRWDQHLEEKDYSNILKLVLCSQSITKARLHFPSPPPVVDKEALEDVVIYDKTVEWIIGPRLIQTLNMETAIWEIAFNTKYVSFIGYRQTGTAQDSTIEQSREPSTSASLPGISGISTSTQTKQETLKGHGTEFSQFTSETPVSEKGRKMDSTEEEETQSFQQGESQVGAQVEYDFDAVDPEDMTIKVGETITNISMVYDGWWKGEVEDQKGLFPSNYVKVINLDSSKCAVTTTAANGQSGAEVVERATENYSQNEKLRAKVIHSYAPQNDDELSLEVDDEIEVTSQPEEGRWEGIIVKGRKGMFPSNFVVLLPDEEEKTRHDNAIPDGTVDLMTDLHKEQFIDEHGGTLFLHEADVSLHVPAGALTNGCMVHVIVPSNPRNFCLGPEDHPRTTPLIICEPDSLQFHLPVKLTLPHCAVLKKSRNHTVEVKFGQKADQTAKEMKWVSETVKYSLSEHYCIVYLNHFSGVDVIIGSVEEKILRIIPYTKLGHTCSKQALTVWFCNDLESDFQNVIQNEEENGGLPLDSYDTFRLRCVSGMESKIKVRVEVLEGSSWCPDKDETRIVVKRMWTSSKSKCKFWLVSNGSGDESYMYFLLRVTQAVGEEKTETTFALRKRTCDLKMPVAVRKLYTPKRKNSHLFPTETEESPRSYTAVVYMDPVKHFNDDIIMTVWLSPFDSSDEMFKSLKDEQKLHFKHKVDSEDSFSVVDDKPAIVTKTQFLNGHWLLSPDEMKIETDRIRFGSRAKFQFIGHRGKKDESDYIELEVKTFQVDEEEIRFIAEVELNQLLYDIRRKKVEELTASANTEYSNSSTKDQSDKSQESQINLLPSTSSTVINKERGKQSAKGNISSSDIEGKSRTPEKQLRRCFMFLKTKLAGKWKDFGRSLDLTEEELTCLGKDYTGDTEEIVYQMLLSWHQINGAQATPEILIETLKEINRKDLADKLATL